MTVLIIIEEKLTLDRAPPSRAINLALELQNNNISTTLLGGYSDDDKVINSLKDVLGVKRKYNGNLGTIHFRIIFIINLIKILVSRDIKYSIIRGRRSSMFWLVILKIFRIKTLFDFHGFGYKLEKSGQGKYLPLVSKLRDFFCLKFSDGVITQNEYNAQEAGKMNTNVIFLDNGVDINRFSIMQGSKRKLKKQYLLKYGIPSDRTIVGFVASNISEWMDLECMLEASKHYSEKIIFLVVGEGKSLDKVKKDKYPKVFFTGKVKNLEVKHLLNIIDIGVYSITDCIVNDFWGSPRKIREWIAMEIPTIMTDVYPRPSFLIEGKNVLYCKPNDPQDLAEKINFLANDKNYMEKMRNYNKKIRDTLSWDSLINNSNLMNTLQK